MEFKLLWREAGPPNHLDDKVDSDQKVVNKNPPDLLVQQEKGPGRKQPSSSTSAPSTSSVGPPRNETRFNELSLWAGSGI